MTNCERAIIYLEACESVCGRALLYSYRDSATQEIWVLSRSSMDRFGEMLDEAEDEDEAALAHERWCRGCPGRTLDLDEVVAEYDLDVDSDLDAARRDALEAGDQLAFVGLDQWRDDLLEIIAQNAEYSATA